MSFFQKNSKIFLHDFFTILSEKYEYFFVVYIDKENKISRG